MNDDETTTVTWIDQNTAELVERDLPADIAEAVMRGERAFPRDTPARRFSAKDAQARLRARVDQLEARMGELVSEHPELKAKRRRLR
jgi:hypothetical protein